jgi:serine/threonine-protein kinase
MLQVCHGGRPPMVKVLDFGISKARDVSLRDGRITKQGQVLGSPEYMSPEAARGDEVDARADIYAVGIILYELVTGKVPFRSDNYLKVLQQHISQKPVPPRQLVPELPEAMERLILRALAKHPDGRHQTMEELEQDLLEAMPEEASRVLSPRRTPSGGNWLLTPPVGIPLTRSVSEPPPVATTPSTPVPVIATEPAPLPEPHSPTLDVTAPTAGRRRFLIRAGVAAVLAILLAAIGFHQLGGNSKKEEQPRTPAAVIPPSPTPSAPAPSAPTPAPPAQPEQAPAPTPPRPTADRIPFRVDSVPRGATVTLNGKLVGRTPVAIQVGRGRKPGQLKVTLKDHEPVSQKVDLSRPVDLNIPLQHAAVAKPDAGATDLELRQNR